MEEVAAVVTVDLFAPVTGATAPANGVLRQAGLGMTIQAC